MSASWKTALLAGAAISIFAGAAWAQDAGPVQPSEAASNAQQEAQEQADDASESADLLTGIVVTARRREESLQDVPVAVTAFTAERLESTGAQDITELTRMTPSLTLQAARGSNSTLISFIRGIGQQDPLWGFEPGVGLYVDDVYIARPQAAVLDIFDISRIEVLRGPQGTLYGRNTIGGAIKYVTDKIGSQPELKIRADLGSYRQTDLIVSGERRLTEKLAVSGAFAEYHRDGFGENLNTGTSHYNKDVRAFRASIEFAPTENLFFRLAGDKVRDESNARHGYRELAPKPGSVYDTNAGAGDNNVVETRGVSLLGEWRYSDEITFKSISAYRTGFTEGQIDFDNLPAPLLDIPARYNDHQFSQELQVLYEGERLQGVAGVYYLNANAAGAFDTVLGTLNTTTFNGGAVDTRSYAVFADFSYDVTEALSISVGGRYTSDEKRVNQLRRSFSGLRSPFFGNSAAVVLATRTNYTAEKTFEQFTPRLSVRYEFSPELTAYASYAKGFKSGGFDMRGDAVAYPQTVEGYDPEIVDTYEAGLKGALLDGRLNFATAVFTTDYQDLQITTQFPTATPGVIASVVDNVGQASIKGWEGEGSFRVSENLVFNGMLSYVDAEFEEFLGYVPTGPLNSTCPTLPGCVIDLSNARDFSNTPEWTGSVGLTAELPLANGSRINFTPSASYRGPYQLFETPQPILDQREGFWLYDASVVWTSADDRIRIGVHGKNLGDERYRVGGYDFSSFGALTGNTVIGFYGPPRTFTASFNVRF